MRENKGITTIEATITLPIFIFVMLTFWCIGKSKMAEIEVYEACAETAEYMAEYGYVSDSGGMLPYLIFDDYINNKELVESFVDGGISGVDFLFSEGSDSDNNTVLRGQYSIKISLPFLPQLKSQKNIKIRQKQYSGIDSYENSDDEEYVFVAENGTVYHNSRNCTHLRLSIYTCGVELAREGGYSACRFCGADCGNEVYITENGNRYHSSRLCSGLKRSVYREKKSELTNMSECSRCGY